ncbi:MAG TPA: hypothetical protein VNZ52_17030 [Candidatus Thermoplasmatota archaeon]|nr:hypothetical protein [Candidatus Thermoplasmatota archaeon]
MQAEDDATLPVTRYYVPVRVTFIVPRFVDATSPAQALERAKVEVSKLPLSLNGATAQPPRPIISGHLKTVEEAR